MQITELNARVKVEERKEYQGEKGTHPEFKKLIISGGYTLIRVRRAFAISISSFATEA